MASRSIVVDDINGNEASGTVVFGLDGKTYEIDLDQENLTELRGTLEKFVAGARVFKGKAVVKPTGPDTKVVRAWATENGFEVNPRGRLHQDVIKAYQEAQSTTV